MKKEERKYLAKRIGMTEKSVKALYELGYLQENMTDEQIGLFLCSKDEILDEIASGFPGFRRVKEITERLILVNCDGLVLDGLKKKPLVQSTNSVYGEPAYKYISCNADGKQKNHFVHRLVASCFCPNEKGKDFVHHINGDKNDNRAENLIWVSLYEHHLFHKMARKKDKNFYRMFLDCVQTENMGLEWKGYFNR